MNSEFSDIEAQLAGMRPQRLDDELSLRLKGLLDRGGLELSDDELAFEHDLLAMRPVALSPRQFSAFAGLLDEVPAAAPPVESSKVIEFPAVQRRQRPLWASAAAVAILGAFTALMLPKGKPNRAETVVVQNTPVASLAAPGLAAADSPNIVPAGFNRGIQSAQDQGVVWHGGRGTRVVKVEYLDKAVIQKDGKKVEVQQPRVEYLVVPENVD